MHRLNVKKGEILQRAGDANQNVYHVVSGLLRSYSIDEHGKEHIYMFAPENWLMGEVVSEGHKSKLFIEALEDSVLVPMEKDSVQLLEPKKLLKRVEVLQNRILMLMSSNALERYENFAETYPDIIQRVPQKMIASYIGVTPEALSSLKSKSLKK